MVPVVDASQGDTIVAAFDNATFAAVCGVRLGGKFKRGMDLFGEVEEGNKGDDKDKFLLKTVRIRRVF